MTAGDPHASERIGPSCSRIQLAVTLSQLVAAARGAGTADLSLIQVGGASMCIKALNPSVYCEMVL